MVCVEAYEARFSRLKEVDSGKDKIIEDLISEVKKLESSLRETTLGLEREQGTTKLFQSTYHDVQVKLKKMEESIRSNSFVSVLIDGDSMPFVDRLVISGKEGGMEAARQLKSNICEYVTNELKLPNNIQVRVRIYAGTKGLASTYHHNKILDGTVSFDAFIRGFNMGNPMTDFIDAGDGKECADSKLKAWFDHDIADAQCQAVVFGGSADNGYARVLQPCAGDSTKNKRIILIEGPPFAKELAEIKDRFLVVRFPGIFRDTKLPTRRVSFSTTPPATPSPNARSYAAIASPADAADVRTSDAHERPLIVPARRNYPLLKNSRRQRLDVPINPPQSLVRVLRDKKLCNMFHILGECTYTDCNYIHGARLDEKGIEARRFLSRQGPCLTGLYCEDEKCLFGHQCPDRACAKVGRGCRFSPEMHSVDTS